MMDMPSPYAEYSVKKEYVGAYGKRRVILIAGYVLFSVAALTVLFVLFGGFSIFFFIPLITVCVYAVMIPTYRRFCCIEYDYRVTAGEPGPGGAGGTLDIAEVYYGRSRKEVFTARLSNIETVAPYSGSHRESADGIEYDKIFDATSRIDSDGVYYAVVNGSSHGSEYEKLLLLFEPSENMLRIMNREMSRSGGIRRTVIYKNE